MGWRANSSQLKATHCSPFPLLRLQEYVHSGSRWAVGHGGVAAGDRDLIGNVNRGLLSSKDGGGRSQEGCGENGETHLDLWLFFSGEKKG